MISVLVADDSFLMRRLIGDCLSSDPDIQVVGSVSDGEQVIAEVKRLNPDVITMDLEMPKLNGLEATKRIMAEAGAQPIVLMVSSFGTTQADKMLDCLNAGAFDCVVKPSDQHALDLDTIKAQLIAKVKAAASARRSTLAPQKTENRPASVPTITQSANTKLPFPLVLIGSSTGGPPVLEEIFSHLPASISGAILVVQHMPPTFTASMAERLDRLSNIKVKEATDGESIKPGVALVAPGNFHMRVAKSRELGKEIFVVKLSQDAPVHNLRPSIDVMMESACDVFPGPMVGMLLTGMGEDGAVGMQRIHAKKGATLVQDPETCVVDSMVQSALKLSEIDVISSPQNIAHYIDSLTKV